MTCSWLLRATMQPRMTRRFHSHPPDRPYQQWRRGAAASLPQSCCCTWGYGRVDQDWIKDKRWQPPLLVVYSAAIRWWYANSEQTGPLVPCHLNLLHHGIHTVKPRRPLVWIYRHQNWTHPCVDVVLGSGLETSVHMVAQTSGWANYMGPSAPDDSASAACG